LSELRLHCIKWFNHQNAIDGLEKGFATEGDGRLTVSLPSNSGCELEFNRDNISIVSVKPYTEEEMLRDGSVYAPQVAGKRRASLDGAKPV
jgi:hypothetical protein